MAVSCLTNDLLRESRCYSDCIPAGMQQAVQIYLLQQIAGNTMTAQELMAEARCFQDCIPDGMKPAVMLYLLCSIVNS